MSYESKELRRIWKSTNGRCHLTGRRLRLKDYGRTWEVDHSKPRAKGGSDHGNNLKPALIRANRSKQASTSRSVRRRHGLVRSPMSAAERSRRRARNAVDGAAVGAVAGGLVGGPGGAAIGSVLGALLGRAVEPEPRKANR